MELDSPGPRKLLCYWIFCSVFLSNFQCDAYKYKCPEDVLIADLQHRTVTSPEYPKKYSKWTECEWKMVAMNHSMKIKLYVNDLDMEDDKDCDYDALDIYDGPNDDYRRLTRLCGSKRNISFVSSGMYLYFEFMTDKLLNGRGFNITYYAVPFQTKSTLSGGKTPDYDHDLDKDDQPKQKKSSKYMVIGAVFGGVCLVVLVTVILCLCLSKRGCCRSTSRNRGPSVSPGDFGRRRRQNRTREPPPPPQNFNGPWTTDSIPMYSLTPYTCAQYPQAPPPYQESDPYEYVVHEEVREHPPIPSSPPPSYSSQDLPPNFWNVSRDSPPNAIYHYSN